MPAVKFFLRLGVCACLILNESPNFQGTLDFIFCEKFNYI